MLRLELPKVIIESPFAGDVEGNITYARRAVKDSVHRGEAPIASHLLFTQPGILNDDDPDERLLGCEAGWAWLRVADKMAVYADRGISSGMRMAIELAKQTGLPIEYRKLDDHAHAVWTE